MYNMQENTWLIPLLITAAFNAGVLLAALRSKISRTDAALMIQEHVKTCSIPAELRHKLDQTTGAIMERDIKYMRQEITELKKELSIVGTELHQIKNILVKVSASMEVSR